jgi:NMD protein affecting ribosome stability and mRNA decay
MPVSIPPNCDKHIDYFEAIIQMRPFKEEIYRMILNQFKKSRTAWISKTIQGKTGWDLQVSSWRFALALGKKMKKAFGGKITTSRSIFSRDNQSSKRVYRVTVCHRLDE